MGEKTYSPDDQAVIDAIVEIVKEHGGKATYEEVYEALPEKMNLTVDEDAASKIHELITTSSSDSCSFVPGDKGCVYLASNGTDEIAVEVNPDAVKGGKEDITEKLKKTTLADTPSDDSDFAVEDLQFVMLPYEAADAVVEPYQTAPAGSEKAEEAKEVEDKNAGKGTNVMADNLAKEKAQADEQAKVYDEMQVEDNIDYMDDVIKEEKAKIAKHEEQIDKDKTKFMKDIHEMEIHHDEKVIDRREAELKDSEATLDNIDKCDD